LGGDLGLRHVLTDPDPIEISWLVVAGGDYRKYVFENDMGEASDWSVTTRVGLVLQRHFTDWLALRVRADLVEAGYSKSRYRDWWTPQTSSSLWFASLTAEPSVALRFAF
jgi:hypothetical protein